MLPLLPATSADGIFEAARDNKPPPSHSQGLVTPKFDLSFSFFTIHQMQIVPAPKTWLRTQRILHGRIAGRRWCAAGGTEPVQNNKDLKTQVRKYMLCIFSVLLGNSGDVSSSASKKFVRNIL